MKNRKTKYLPLAFLALASLMPACSNELEEIVSTEKRGTPAYAEVSIGEMTTSTQTRATHWNDGRSVAAFSKGDKVGFYSLSGLQNLYDENDFSLPIVNDFMNYEGMINGKYRFGNSDLIIDPATVNKAYSKMYYPYYPDMPSTTDNNKLVGIPLRETDPADGVDKCIDFMLTNTSNISIQNGVLLNPSFSHICAMIVLQRGEGFQNPKDPRIFVIMKEPYTDVRLYQYNYSPTNYFTTTFQYNPDPSLTEDELVCEIVPGESKGKINRYRVWEAWKGADYNGQPANYVIIPPYTVTYVLIQDDYGTWQNVTDFYLYDKPYKTTNGGYRYILKIQLEGLDVTARPVAVEKWDDEMEISDDRKVGIHDFAEYNQWAITYNAYIEEGKSNEMRIEQLKAYGDSKTNTLTNEIEWTFYVNDDIEFPNNEFVQVKRLDDRIEGSSTYKNYCVSNIRGTLFGEMGPKGSVGSLDFNDIYLIQNEADLQPYSPLVGTLNGGAIENCNVNNAIVVSHAPAGMAAAVVNGGRITDCTFSGSVVGTESASFNGIRGLFGTVTASPTLTNVNTKGLNFSSY